MGDEGEGAAHLGLQREAEVSGVERDCAIDIRDQIAHRRHISSFAGDLSCTRGDECGIVAEWERR